MWRTLAPGRNTKLPNLGPKNAVSGFFATKLPQIRTAAGHSTGKTAAQTTVRSRKYLYVAAGAVATTAGAYYIDTSFLSSTGVRSIRAFYVLMWIAYEYSRNSDKYENLEDLHEVTSEALLQLLMENKGLYIKLGQAIANQGSIFPVAYQKRFSKLYDEAPVTPWAKVDRVLREELGENYGEIVQVDRTPIASASIAQVHRGRLSTGEDVAVKVQHYYMKNQIVADLAMYRLISRIYEYVFELPMTMFTRYVLDQMHHETSFIQERKNGDKLAHMIAHDNSARKLNVHVPRTYPDVLTDRVLITEWIDGILMVSRERMEAAGYSAATAMDQYLRLFGRQFFKYGFVHSDPHPGNLMVRFDAHKKQQLVILDHGLYITLPDKFRRQFRDLWRYIFSLDTGGIHRISQDWGIGSSQMFTTMVTLRAPDGTDRPMRPPHMGGGSGGGGEKGEKSDIKALFRDFLSDEKRFPMELLFLMRTQRMIQNLNLQMGSPVNRINLLTKELVAAALAERPHWAAWWGLWRVRLALLVSDVVFWVFRLHQMLTGRHDSSGGIERYIMEVTKESSRAMGFDVWDGEAEASAAS